MPLLFVPGDAARSGCLWEGRGLHYSACVEPQQLRLRRNGREVVLRYKGRSGAFEVAPESAPAAQISVFHGADPSGWRGAEQAFASIKIRDLYPGIDAVLSSRDGELKIDYAVAPFADPAAIRISFPGALRVQVGSDGGLLIETPRGDWREAPPVLYQPGAVAEPVAGRVVVDSDGSARFETGPYDRSRPLVIDPVLTYSSVFGGTGASSAEALAIGTDGKIVVVGFTDASDFPAVNPQRTFAGGVEAVILTFAPSGGSMLQATFIGGSTDDRAFAVAVDPAGGIYVAGWTTSSNFPTVNAWRSTRSGPRDAFLARLAPGGASLTFSTYLGGSDVERATALAADAGGVWVAGETESVDFPTVAAYQMARGGLQDGFLARFTTSGAVVSSSYLGGSQSDTIRAIALSASGEVYVGGGTESSNLPVPASGWRPGPGGGQDGFVLRLDASASAVTGGTYLGGSAGAMGDTELVQSVAIAPDGSLIAGGTTPSADFPLHQPWIAAKGGASMGFVVKLQDDLSQPVWSTFVGGGSTDRVEGVAVDTLGRVYAAGRTFSLDLPLAAPLFNSYRGGGDAFLIALSAAGDTQVFGAYLGGQGSDSAVGVRIAPNGDAVLAGISDSDDFPLAPPAQAPSGNRARFFISVVSMAFHDPDPISVTPNSATGEQQIFEFLVRDGDGATDIQTIVILINATFTSSNACYLTAEPGPGLISLASDSGLDWSGATAGSSTVLQNSQCQLRASGSGFSFSGNDLRLTLDLAFTAGFGGTKQIQVLATDAQGASSAWKGLGSYTVSPPVVGAPPVLSAIHPASASGIRQVFSVTVTDPQGGQDVKEAQLLLAPSQAFAQACWVRFTSGPSQIHLASDTGSSWSSATPGSSMVIENSQCRVHAAGSGASLGASAAVFWAEIEFFPAWSGHRHIYGAATDLSNLEAPWTELADFLITASPNAKPIISGFAAPPTGGGVFVFEAEDANGAADLRGLHVLVGGTPATEGCLILFDLARNRLSIHPGVDGAPWPGLTPGQSASVENARCRVRGEGSSASLSNGMVAFRIQIEFKSGFQGLKAVQAHVLDASGELSVPFRLLHRQPIP